MAATKSGGQLDKQLQPFFARLMDYYAQSKLRDASSKVGRVRNLMADGVRRAIEGHDHLGDLEDKSGAEFTISSVGILVS